MAIKWCGSTVLSCELCSRPIVRVFVDGKMHAGPWAIMCPTCHRNHGIGLGCGRGQKFTKQADATFVKTGG